MTLVGQIVFVTINELRCFHKHPHFCEISDKLYVHCDVKHKNSMSYPAITIRTASVRYKQICYHFYGSVWPKVHDTSVVMQDFRHALLYVKQASSLLLNLAICLRYMTTWNYNRTDTMLVS